MDDEELARLLGWTRVVIGGTFFAMPSLAGRMWTGARYQPPEMRMALRSLGARDAVLGVGLLKALDKNAATRGWLEAGAVSDISDALSVAAARRVFSRPRLLLSVASAASAAWLGMRLARSLD